MGRASTHTVDVGEDVVTKTFVSWDRGEHLREISALRHLEHEAPGLAPRLLASGPDHVPPWLRMTRLSGAVVPGAWSTAQLERLVRAHERLWSVGSDALPPLVGDPARDVAFWRGLIARHPRPTDPEAAAVHDEAGSWLDSRDAERLATVESRPVLGQGDPNLANFLVDDDVVRLVDFEDAGRSTEVYELANLVEHLANRATGFEAVIDAFDVRASDLLLCRRLVALFWFLLLAPGGGAHARNPPGTFEAQGRRLQALLHG